MLISLPRPSSPPLSLTPLTITPLPQHIFDVQIRVPHGSILGPSLLICYHFRDLWRILRHTISYVFCCHQNCCNCCFSSKLEYCNSLYHNIVLHDILKVEASTCAKLFKKNNFLLLFYVIKVYTVVSKHHLYVCKKCMCCVRVGVRL